APRPVLPALPGAGLPALRRPRRGGPAPHWRHARCSLLRGADGDVPGAGPRAGAGRLAPQRGVGAGVNPFRPRPLLAASAGLLALSLALIPVERVRIAAARGTAAADLRQREDDLQRRWTDLLSRMEVASQVPPTVLARVATGSVDQAFAEVAR